MNNNEKPRGKHASGVKGEVNDTPVEEAASASNDAKTELIAPVEDKPTKVGGKHAVNEPDSDDLTEVIEPLEPIGTAVQANQASKVSPVEPIDPNGTTGFVATDFNEIPLKKRRRGLKVLGITAGIVIGVLLVAYIAGAVVFMGRMLPNTTIAGKDIALETDEEVCQVIDSMVSDYKLDVIGSGFSYRTDGAGVGLSIDSKGIVSAIHKELNPWMWPVLMLGPKHDETELLSVSFDPKQYEAEVTDSINAYNETAQAPVNATIIYDPKASKFIVKPEEKGTQLEAMSVLNAMANAIKALEPKVVLTDAEMIQPSVLSTDEKLIEAAKLATGMVSADLALYMNGELVSTVNGEMLSDFISIDDSYEVVFKEDEMNAWVDGFASEFNTVGTERWYTRADGKEVEVPAGGVYGWEIDTEALRNELIEGVKAGTKAQIDIPCYQTAEAYNGPGGRDWGARYIDVDLSEQYVRYYGDDGAIIWEAPCISGTPDGTHNTGPGVWCVNGKESPSKLIGYENGKKIYETTVTYWMPFEGNGIGFHDATWQPGFGGSMYANGYGSHGCVNLSYSDAEALYDIIQYGDCVVVHY